MSESRERTDSLGMETERSTPIARIRRYLRARRWKLTIDDYMVLSAIEIEAGGTQDWVAVDELRDFCRENTDSGPLPVDRCLWRLWSIGATEMVATDLEPQRVKVSVKARDLLRGDWLEYAERWAA